MRKNRSSELKRVELIRKSQEEIRLELVAQADHHTKDGGILILGNLIAVFKAILGVGHNAIDVRALGKRIVVTGRHDPTGHFVTVINTISGFSIEGFTIIENKDLQTIKR